MKEILGKIKVQKKDRHEISKLSNMIVLCVLKI